MNKKKISEEIEKAKDAHVLWFANAMALSVGTDPGDSSVPKKHTECTFGKWYYGVKENKEVEKPDSFFEIEDIHKKLHDKYNKIFKDFENLSASGFFDDISLRNSPEQEKFNDSIEELKLISKELLDKLEKFKSDINK